MFFVSGIHIIQFCVMVQEDSKSNVQTYRAGLGNFSPKSEGTFAILHAVPVRNLQGHVPLPPLDTPLTGRLFHD